jgi:hypothetical protein
MEASRQTWDVLCGPAVYSLWTWQSAWLAAVVHGVQVRHITCRILLGRTEWAHRGQWVIPHADVTMSASLLLNVMPSVIDYWP